MVGYVMFSLQLISIPYDCIKCGVIADNGIAPKHYLLSPSDLF